MTPKIIQNPKSYTKDRGLTKHTTDAPLKVIKADASWNRATANEGQKSGILVGASTYQKFAPYQTKFESNKINNSGIIKQSDRQHPWVLNTEAQWADVIKYPPSFKEDLDIEGWYEDQIETQKELYEWKTDIFGNQYGLYKDFSTPALPISLYNKVHTFGELWVSNAVNKISPATEALSGIYINYRSVYPTIYSQLINNQIKDIDIFYDTLMIVTPTHITLDKILMDYNTANISSIADNSHVLTLSGGKFADTWFFEDSKRVIFCYVRLENEIPIPYLYELDLQKNNFIKRFPLDSNLNDLLSLSSYNISAIDYPVFTYNSDRKVYDIALYVKGGIGRRDFSNIDWRWTALECTPVSGANPKTWKELKRTPNNVPARWFEAACENISPPADLGDSILFINISNMANLYEIENVLLLQPIDISNA